VEFPISALLTAFMLAYLLTIQIFRALKQCSTLDISAEIPSRSFSLQRYIRHTHSVLEQSLCTLRLSESLNLLHLDKWCAILIVPLILALFDLLMTYWFWVGGLALWYRCLLYEQSCSTFNPVSTGMGDRLWAGIPPWYVTKPTRSTQPCIPLGSLNWVPALIG